MPWIQIKIKPCDNCNLPLIDPRIGDGSIFQCDICKKEYIVYTKMFSKEQTYKEYIPTDDYSMYY